MCTSAWARRSPSTRPRRPTPRRAASPRCSATSSTTRPMATSSARAGARGRARATWTSASTSAPPTSCISRSSASYVSDYGVTSFKYFMNFKGEEGRYLGLDGTDDGFFYDLLRESARVGAADHRLPHREHRDRQPRAPARCRPRAAARSRTGRLPSPRHRVRARAARHVLGRGPRRARVLSAHLLAHGARRGPPLAPALSRT